MPTLVEALEGKYGPEDGDGMDSGIPIAIYVPRKGPRNIVPSLLVLNDCDIDSAGDENDLQKKCHVVEELDLAQNNLTHWADVLTILRLMPQVKFANLSFNNLAEELTDELCNKESGVAAFPLLRNLVLISTHASWATVKKLLNLLPNLEELHLSLNDFSTVELTDAADSIHSNIKRLHFTGNPICSWNEVSKLGQAFPVLESLVLADCPLISLDPTMPVLKCKADDSEESEDSCSSCGSPPIQQYGRCESECESAGPKPYSAHDAFRHLRSLNVTGTQIASWDDIDRLACFPALHCLRINACPLFEEYTEHERRQLLIARLPNVQTLNGGGVISPEEREDAERAFIRYYMEKPESDRPERYGNLLGVHGRLDPLVNIDLSPEKRVKVKIIWGDKSEVKSINVYQTVSELKKTLEPVCGIAASKMRLFYGDQDYKDTHSPHEFMKYPNKQLYSYNITSGDEIVVDTK
ncbi:hypothetical protein ONE63_001783 [Megalurothrips usitatus]|uniref:Ubiquitin-like domain-containing protein n=1 Tax=Megalurothrips usitatus TaxID=439358 RepID=A0AAV7X9F6_9NEOP|nr:hypothetical protein ONE63_001783 [Megalurothrips usitatus]